MSHVFLRQIEPEERMGRLIARRVKEVHYTIEKEQNMAIVPNASLSIEEQLQIWNTILPGLTVGNLLERASQPLHPDARYLFIMPSPYAIADSMPGALKKLFTLKREGIRFGELHSDEGINGLEYEESLISLHKTLEAERMGDYWAIQALLTRDHKSKYRGSLYEVAGVLLTHPGIIARDQPAGDFINCPGSKPKGTRNHARDDEEMLRFFKLRELYWCDYCWRGDLHMGHRMIYMFSPKE